MADTSLLFSKGRCELDFLCAALRTMNHLSELAKIQMGAARLEEAGIEQRISLVSTAVGFQASAAE